jgi:hypothetical protein
MIGRAPRFALSFLVLFMIEEEARGPRFATRTIYKRVHVFVVANLAIVHRVHAVCVSNVGTGNIYRAGNHVRVTRALSVHEF